MDKQELFSGLREGLKLMKSGETVTFMFPSQKAFGYYGDEDRIGINVPLKCEVSVNSIIDK
jgi:FKBP-type peptidyl-prolyl cis-trans isomerase